MPNDTSFALVLDMKLLVHTPLHPSKPKKRSIAQREISPDVTYRLRRQTFVVSTVICLDDSHLIATDLKAVAERCLSEHPTGVKVDKSCGFLMCRNFPTCVTKL